MQADAACYCPKPIGGENSIAENDRMGHDQMESKPVQSVNT